MLDNINNFVKNQANGGIPIIEKIVHTQTLPNNKLYWANEYRSFKYNN